MFRVLLHLKILKKKKWSQEFNHHSQIARAVLKMKWSLLLSLFIGTYSYVLFPNKIVPLQAPLRVLYIDHTSIDYNNPANTIFNATAAGYNVLIFGFYLSTAGPYDMSQTWLQLGSSIQQQIINKLHSQGVAALVSYGGSGDIPYSQDATTAGTQVRFFSIIFK